MRYTTYAEYLASAEFAEVRAAVIRRSGGRCENMLHCSGGIRCSRRVDDVHHIAYCKWGEVDTPANLLAVCRTCHKRLHTCTQCGGRLTSEAIKAKRNTCRWCSDIITGTK